MEASPSVSLYSWGINKDGQLGTGKQSKEEYLPQLLKIKHIISISAASLQTLALDRTGKVFGWGSNSKNRLGSQTSQENIYSPQELSLPAKISQISCGYWHSLALSENGAAYSCGNNKNGELGRIGDPSQFLQVELEEPMARVEGGFGVSFFIGRNHLLYSCGKDVLSGQKKPEGGPTVVKQFQNGVVDVSAGYKHFGVIDVEGNLFMWGDNKEKALGLGQKSPDYVAQPTMVTFFQQNGLAVKQISCSQGEKHSHSACVLTDGRAFFWGDPYKGKLGTLSEWNHKVKSFVPQPQLLEQEDLGPIRKVICGGIHSAVLSEDGRLFTFGCGSNGRIGHPEFKGHTYLYKESRPRMIQAFEGKRVVDAVSSYYHMVALVQN